MKASRKLMHEHVDAKTNNVVLLTDLSYITASLKSANHDNLIQAVENLPTKYGKDGGCTVGDDHSYNIHYDGQLCEAILETPSSSVPSLQSMHPASTDVNFTSDETKRLIAVWASRAIRDRFKTEPRYAYVYEEMSRVLGAMGYRRSGRAIRKKLMNLKAMYSACKKRMDAGATSLDWVHWDDMDRAMSAYADTAQECLEPVADTPTVNVGGEDVTEFPDFGDDSNLDFSPDSPSGVEAVFTERLSPLMSEERDATVTDSGTRKRAANFTRAETEALIDEWSSGRVQALLACRRNALAYEELSRRMRRRGFCKAGSTVRKKMLNLRATYQMERRALDAGVSASAWPYWDAMHRAMSTPRPDVDHNDALTLGEEEGGETASAGITWDAGLPRGHVEEGETASMDLPRLPRGHVEAFSPKARFARGRGPAYLRNSSPRGGRELRLLQQVVDIDRRFLAIAQRRLKMEEESRAKKDRMMEAQTRFYDSFARLARDVDGQTSGHALDVVSRLVVAQREGVAQRESVAQRGVAQREGVAQRGVAQRVVALGTKSCDRPTENGLATTPNKPVFYKIVTKTVPSVKREPPT